MPKGDAIAYDERGRPTIVRHVDEQTGLARTVVKNEDGTKRVFGKNTIDTLASSDLEQSKAWAADLTAHQLRGLAHEVGQRLLEGSRLYHSRVAELENLADLLNFMYFSLSPDCSEKELDNAYRKFARKMHPDKNGGTEEAKHKFQQMKERYEALKKKFEDKGGKAGQELLRAVGDGDAGDVEAAARAAGERVPARHHEESGLDHGNKASDNDAERAGDKDAEEKDERSTTKYDPKDKDAMVKNVIKMMKQYKSIEVQMEILVEELERARRAAAAGGAAA